MISIFVAIVFSFTSQAAEITIQPTYQKAPFLALSNVEVDLEVGEMFAILKRRATDLCEFAKAPAGRYRSRVALRMKTKRIKTLGQKVAFLRKSGGSYSASVSKLGAELRTEVFTSIDCLGKP